MLELERTAIHEAGHVVAALAFGFDVDTAHIRPAAACLGLAIIRPAPPTAGLEGAAVLAAGDAAVALAEAGAAYPRQVPGAAWLRQHLARQRAESRTWRRPSNPAASGAIDAPNDATLTTRATAGDPVAAAAARDRATIILRHRWRTVHAVAGVLLRDGEIDGGTARACWRVNERQDPPAARTAQPAPAAKVKPAPGATRKADHPKRLVVVTAPVRRMTAWGPWT